jgi:hypothetical protein
MLIRPVEHLAKNNILATDHVGTVVFNNDPKKIGRIKCTVPALWGSDQAKMPWVYPQGGGGFHVPAVGDRVNITFPFDDVLHPVYDGFPENSANHNTIFDVNYPNSYGRADSTGFYWRRNKTSGEFKVHHPGGGGVDITVDSGGNITIAGGSGDVSVTSASGDVSITAGGNVNLDATGSVDISAANVNLN